MQLNRNISYTYSWRYTALISVILSAFIIAILILLQPFDTYQYNDYYKTVKLFGYCLVIATPILLFHTLENYWFLKDNKRWRLSKEIITISTVFITISVFAYMYNSYVINNTPISWQGAINWSLSFGLPFAPLFIPIWIYLRFRFSKVTITPESNDTETLITIKGNNNDEQVQFVWPEFVMAKSQSNYIDIFLFTKQGTIQKHVLRSTLSGLVDQLPMATQVHRSFLVNTDYITTLHGNTRKGSAVLSSISTEIPVSPKHFTALKNHLQSRP
jgi:hypothetical protein